MTDPVILTGRDLTPQQLEAVARRRAPVELGPLARQQIQRARAVIDHLIDQRAIVYGLTTGFGSKRSVFIDPEDTEQLQLNLIRSHACGLGDPEPEDVVRAAMLLRANTLALGHSGVRLETVELLVALLNAGVYPYVPQKGSLGASGDLAPLSHLALVLLGDPHGLIHDPEAPAPESARRGTFIERPRRRDFIPSTPDALKGFGLSPVSLGAKEGLALNNGCQVLTAKGMLTVLDARHLVASAEGACAMSLEAMSGSRRAFHPDLHRARPFPGQRQTARNILRLVRRSALLELPVNMARINNTRQKLLDGRALLDGNEGWQLAVDGLLGDALVPLDRVRGGARAVLARERRRISREERESLPDEAVKIKAFRQALRPSAEALLQAYRILLDHPEVMEQTRQLVSEALQELERAVLLVPRVQDDYSIRCTPQVLGAVRQTLDHAEEVMRVEMNAATDNPLIFPPPIRAGESQEDWASRLTVRTCQAAVISGGNFHGAPVGFALDYLAIGLSEVASISERRTAKLVDGNLSNGLPSLLVRHSGLNSGFMIPQYTAASLVAENKVLSHPASVDTINTCENSEDHVSMGGLAADKARKILENAERVVAIELLTSWQALHFHRPLHREAGQGTQRLFSMLAEHLDFTERDRVLYPLMEKTTRLVRGAVISDCLADFTG